MTGLDDFFATVGHALIAVGGALLAIVFAVLVVAAGGLATDDLRGWIRIATRKLANSSARHMRDPEEASDYVADVLGELESRDYRPYWLFGDALLTWLTVAVRNRLTVRRVGKAFGFAALMSLVDGAGFYAARGSLTVLDGIVIVVVVQINFAMVGASTRDALPREFVSRS